jgi:hypothetical protein
MKKQRMNSIQENYIVAKAAWKAAKEIQVQKYNRFLVIKGIEDDDITDENFDAFNIEYEVFAKEEIENTDFAWKNYKLAEKALIAFGIATAPTNIRETLANGVKWHLNIKNEMVDSVLKLDVSTLPEGVKNGRNIPRLAR